MSNRHSLANGAIGLLLASGLAFVLWANSTTKAKAAKEIAPAVEEGPIPLRPPAGVEPSRVVASEADRAPPLEASIVFEDGAGRRIPSVQVWFLGASIADPMPTLADADGTIPFPEWTISQSVRVIARHRGYQPFQARFEAPPPDQRVIILREGVSIMGLVVDVHDRVVPTGPTVVAYRNGYAPSKWDLFRALAGEANAVLSSRAGEDGTFEITGLERGEEYMLLAGGGGVLSSSPHACPSGTTDALLRVQELFAARVILDGIPMGPTLWEPPGPQWFWDPSTCGGTGIPTDSLAGALAGFLPTETTRLPSTPLAILFAGAPEAESIGPLSFRGTPAGFDPIDEEVWIPRARGQLPTITIPTRPRMMDRGGATIVFHGLLDRDVDPDNRVRPLGLVWFHSRDGQGSFSYPLAGLSAKPLPIEGIPCGLYEVTLSTESGYSNYPAQGGVIAIRPADSTLVSFDMCLSGEVEIFAQGKDESLVDGEILVEVNQKVNDEYFSSFVTMRRPPYVIQGLIPGQYSLSINKPYFNPEPVWFELTEQTRNATAVFLPR